MQFSGRSRNVDAMKCRAQTPGRRHESSILEISCKITLISASAGSGSKVLDPTLKSRQPKLLNQSNTATDCVSIHLVKSQEPAAGWCHREVTSFQPDHINLMKKPGKAFFWQFIALCSASPTQAGWSLQMQPQRPKGHKTREPLLHQSLLYISTSIWNILRAFIRKLKSNSSSHWIYSKRQLNTQPHCWEIFLFNSCLSLSTVIPLPSSSHIE